MPAARLDRHREWPLISELSCRLFNHPAFTDQTTWTRLERWLLTYHAADREEMQRMSLAHVVEVLRQACEAVRADLAGQGAQVPGEAAGGTSPPEAAAEQNGLTGETKALALLVTHPDWTDTAIAEAVPCNRTTLYKWPKYKAAREALEAGRHEMPRGAKDKEGQLEAWEN